VNEQIDCLRFGDAEPYPERQRIDPKQVSVGSMADG
jgi:hypothetical protein